MNIDFLYSNIDQISPSNLALLNIPNELLLLKNSSLDLNRVKFIFSVEILLKIIKKPNDYRLLIDILLFVLDKYKDTSFIIFRLRIIKNISSFFYFVPMSFYLVDLLNQTINTNESDESQTYDSLSINKVDTTFVLGEIKSLIFENMNKFSDKYGFIEVVGVMIEGIKKISRGIYKEYCENIISGLNKHKEYVKKCRTENIKPLKLIK
ncbi:uncharacterized protein VNE69_08077 [Vairimorpha necatrix]|uniref:Uncharacterized protein n=1 Tax=Vairimorpha necatrix TaxID=6039 RepID=A0AAX4JE94_9MICR